MKTILRKIIWLSLAAAVLLTSGCLPDTRSDMLRIGIPEEPRTLNIFLASDANSKKVLGQIYQALYIREPDNLSLIPWLAQSHPVFDAATTSYTITLRKMNWSDGTPFTADDVVFTANLIKQFKIPRLSSKWRFVKKVEALDAHTVRYHLKRNSPIFHTRTLTGPVVSRHEWESVAGEARTREKPLAHLLNHQITNPIGTGPFVLREWRQGAYIHLSRNPHFFASGKVIASRRLGPYVSDLIFKIYGTSDVAILALKKGVIDMFWWSIQPGYLNDLETADDVDVVFNQKSGLYFMGFNVRKAPYNDVHLRRAAATLIDRDFIITRILQHKGSKMISVIPSGNTFWHNPNVPTYSDHADRAARIRTAHRILANAGYSWETPPVAPDNSIQTPSAIRLPDGREMENFTILTPPADYDPHRAMCGMMIQEWLRDVGMPAFSRPMAFSSLLQKVKARHDFDTFVLGYGKLSLDPDYVRIFFHSKMDKVRGWNMSGYRNKEFDQLANRSRKEMDREKRRELLWEMQRLVIRDVPYIPLYNPNIVECARNDRFRGWVSMIEGIGNVWSFTTIKPTTETSTDRAG